MNIQTESQKENPMLKRKELRVRTTDTGPTPSRVELQKSVSETLGVDNDLVIIDKIFTSFGSPGCTADVEVYASKADVPAQKAKYNAGRMKKAEAKPAEKKEESKDGKA